MPVIGDTDMPGLLDTEFAWPALFLEWLGTGECRALAATTRTLHGSLGSHTGSWAQQKWTWIHTLYHPTILGLLGGSYAMMRMPRLQWQPVFRGSTGYIDGVTPNDMQCPVMLGCQCGGEGVPLIDGDPPRPFVALRTRAPDRRRSVTVLFQRYTGCQGTWASSDYSSIMTECGHFMVDGAIKHELLAFNIGNLLLGKRSIMRFTKFVGNDISPVPRWLE